MRMHGFSGFIGLVLLVTLLFSSGCVSEKLKPEHQPKLGVAQGSGGVLAFRLETEVGYKYKILYLDPKDQRWKTVPGLESITGTGKAVEFKKQFNSRNTVPQFSVSYSKD